LAWESDRLVLLQATLLHQWWWTTSSDLQDPWYWLGSCITLATGIGINHPSTLAAKDNKTQRLWRRIWWVCVIRDRIFGLVQRKPTRIRDEDIALPGLRFQDFDTKPLDTRIPVLAECVEVTDCVNKVLLADIFISQASLLLTVGRILACSYNLQGFVNSTSTWSLFATPKKQEEVDQSQLDRLQAELDNWSSQLNRNCRMNDSEEDELLADHVYAGRAGLRLCYLLAKELLHRPRAFETDPEGWATSRGDCPEDSSTAAARLRVSEVASEITEILGSFHQRGKLLLLPPLTLTCVMTAVAWFLVEMRRAQKSPAELPDHPYHRVIRAVFLFKDHYPIWDETVALLKVMAINQHAWFARTMAMISPSVPMISTPKSASNNTPGATRAGHHVHDTSPSNNEGTVTIQTADEIHKAFGGLHDGTYLSSIDHQHLDHQLSSGTMFMPSMHPFALTPTAFMSSDAMGYDELALGQALDAYGLGDSLHGLMPDFSHGPNHDIQETSTMATAMWGTGTTR
jgi:hypothetical protein